MYKVYQRLQESEDLEFSDEDLGGLKTLNIVAENKDYYIFKPRNAQEFKYFFPLIEIGDYSSAFILVNKNADIGLCFIADGVILNSLRDYVDHSIIEILKSVWQDFDNIYYSKPFIFSPRYTQKDYNIFFSRHKNYEGYLDLSFNSRLISLGELETVSKDLILVECSNLRDLGNLHTVEYSLFLTDTPIKSLGNLKKVGETIVGFSGDKSKYPQFEFRN
jgi:hypothetical protein